MSNTPKVRFAGFTGDWEQRKLSDISWKPSWAPQFVRTASFRKRKDTSRGLFFPAGKHGKTAIEK